MRRACRPLLLFLAVAVLGCSEGPTHIQGERREEASADALKQAGDAALDQRRFADARESYLKALAIAPNDPELHYRLGMALTHLDQNRDAEKSFEQVLLLTGNRGQEAEAAREWLLAHGVVPRPGPAEDHITKTSASPFSETGSVRPLDRNQDPGSIAGQMSWVLPDGRTELIGGRSVELYPAERPGQRLMWKVTNGEGRFRFDDLSPGSYRIAGFYAGPAPLWNLRVDVQTKQETVVGLTETNSIRHQNDFLKP